MSFQAYLDNIKAKTGKTPDDFRKLIAEKGLLKSGEIVAWLKSEFGLGHGHANAISHLIVHAEDLKASRDEKISKLFAGNKIKWHKTYEDLMAKVAKFGTDVSVAPTNTYVSLLRGGNKFAILQPSAIERLDIGIKLKGIPPTARFEAAGSWNNMVTHRVAITDPKQIDAEVITWLKQAYDAT